MIKENYIEKTYAGWLGKVIGIRLGSPIEGWTYEQIQRVYGDIENYLVDYRDYAADDDSNGPLFFVRSLRDYSTDINEITEKEMGYTWLNYAPENHGFFWWGGYGISTEHTAYLNLKNGIDAPRSGSIDQNGASCAEQIGGQIFSDCWGFVAPNNPMLAASYAEKMSSVSHDGEGINGGKFVAACISLAYEETDILALIQKALSILPPDSEYVRVSQEVINFYLNDQSKDFRNCFSFVQSNFGYDKYLGACHIIPNAAIMILSMLYGEGDFSKTQCICNMCGWDTDCNAGNVGAILGVFVGIEGIEEKWINPINDLLISSSVIGSLNISTIPKGVELFCDLGYKIAHMTPPSDWKAILNKTEYYLHFKLPKSTQAMRIRTDSPRVEASVRNSDEELYEGGNTLKLVTNRLSNASEVYLFHKTYYQPEDLHDSRYDPSFSPVCYPGQTVKTNLLNKSGFDIYVQLYVKDINNKVTYKSDSVKLKDKWEELEFNIPIITSGLIAEMGVILFKDADTSIHSNNLVVYMGSLECCGTPNYNVDFGKEQIENYGFGHSTLHREISQFSYLNGFWELEDGSLSGSCCTEGEIYTGYYYLEDYECSWEVSPQLGFHHLVNFRVQGGARSYAFGFYGENEIALLKKHKDYQVLEKQKYNYTLKQSYQIKIKVKSNKITLYINEEEVLNYLDEDKCYNYGQIGMTVLNGSHCHYNKIQFSPSFS